MGNLQIWFALVLLFAVESLGQIPNVYEFCSALMTDGGKQGTCEELEEKQQLFEERMQQKFDSIPKLIYCSLGMTNGDIPDEAITASSFVDFRWAPHNARLNERQHWTSSSSVTSDAAWCASSTSTQWIQVDLGESRLVAGIATQGRPKNQWGENWVKTFKISCGQTMGQLRTITENGSDKIFVGNSDKNTKVFNKFPSVMTCRYVRVQPLTWNIASGWVGPCLRMELLKGECFDLY